MAQKCQQSTAYVQITPLCGVLQGGFLGSLSLRRCHHSCKPFQIPLLFMAHANEFDEILKNRFALKKSLNTIQCFLDLMRSIHQSHQVWKMNWTLEHSICDPYTCYQNLLYKRVEKSWRIIKKSKIACWLDTAPNLRYTYLIKINRPGYNFNHWTPFQSQK